MFSFFYFAQIVLQFYFLCFAYLVVSCRLNCIYEDIQLLLLFIILELELAQFFSIYFQICNVTMSWNIAEFSNQFYTNKSFRGE